MIAPRQSPNWQIRVSGKIIHRAKIKNRINLNESDRKITANASLEVLLPQSRYVTIELVKGVNVELGDISNTLNVKAKPLEMESAVLVRIFRVCYQDDITVPNAFGLNDTLYV